MSVRTAKRITLRHRRNHRVAEKSKPINSALWIHRPPGLIRARSGPAGSPRMTVRLAPAVSVSRAPHLLRRKERTQILPRTAMGSPSRSWSRINGSDRISEWKPSPVRSYQTGRPSGGRSLGAMGAGRLLRSKSPPRRTPHATRARGLGIALQSVKLTGAQHSRPIAGRYFSATMVGHAFRPSIPDAPSTAPDTGKHALKRSSSPAPRHLHGDSRRTTGGQADLPDPVASAVRPYGRPNSMTGPPAIDASLPIRSGAPSLSGMTGSLILDGADLGRWVVGHLEHTLSRPISSMTGIDPRIAPPRSRLSPF